MRLDNNQPPIAAQVSHPTLGKQRGRPLVLVACFLLASCSGVERVAEDTFTGSGNFSGMAAADEPQALLVGRDALTAGGKAADAAVAMAFAMTVTLPSQVALGSSGACLVYDNVLKTVDAITFVPRPVGPVGGDTSMVPGLPRGMFLLHAKYGRLRWDQLLGPAQRLAQQGVPASRAFIRQFAPVADAVLADPIARRLFSRADEQPIGEGDLMRNPELGTALGRLALRGAGDLYSGSWSREFIAAARDAGATFGEDDLRSYAAQSLSPIAVPYGHDMAYFTPPPALTGIVEAQSWVHLAGPAAYKDANPDTRPRLAAATLARALEDRAQWLKSPHEIAELTGEAHVAAAMAGLDPNQSPAEPRTEEPVAGAGLVTVDGSGDAVACEFTLNRPFGTGSMVPNFGTYLAAPTPDVGLGLGPMIAINTNSNEFRLAAAASGGVAGTRSLIRAAAETLLASRPLSDAMDTLKADDSPGRVEAAQCTSGRPSIERCVAKTDPRGAGLAESMAVK